MKLCKRILNVVQVINYKGDVRLCCWIRDNVIGSLSNQSMEEVFHSAHANELREMLGRSDYSLCNIDACPYLAMNDMENNLIEIDEIPQYPQELYLAFENGCNYRCTSCNIHKIMSCIKKEEIEQGCDRVEEQLREILPHVKTIGANGLGELFVSKRILRLLSEWKPIAPAEEISVRLETNGSLFDEAHWKQIENLGQYDLSVGITIMSFEETAYQYLSGTKLPISQIENNLRFVKSLREKGIINHLELATVVQERNFRMLPEFARRCIEEFGADSVRLRPYEPWGNKEPEIEWFADIRNSQHPYHEEYRAVMRHPIFSHPKVQEWSGGRDTVNAKGFPYRLSHLVERILTELTLDIDCVVEKLKAGTTEGNELVIYGFGSVGKVLMKLLSERGIETAYILDKNKPCNPYSDVKVYSLKESGDFNKEVDILITPLQNTETIRQQLKAAGYSGKMLSVTDLLDNESLLEEYHQIMGQ